MEDADANTAANADTDPTHESLSRAIGIAKLTSGLVDHATREEINEAQRSGILWVRFRLSSRLHGALVLIAKLANNDEDQEMWLRAVQLMWPAASSLWLKALRGCRFRVGLDVLVTHGGGGTWFSSCQQLVAPMQIEDEEGVQRRDTATPVIPIRLVVNSDSDRAYLLWRDIRQLVTQQSHASAFRITEVHVIKIQEQWSIPYMNAAHQLAADGVLVRPMAVQVPLSLNDSAFYLPTVRHSIMGDDEGNTHDEYTPSDVVATPFDADDDALDSIFSALSLSPTVRKIIITSEKRSPGNRDRLWQWLAIAFFNSNAINGIQAVKLKSCDLRMRGVVELERTLRDSNPIALLFPTLSHSPSRREQNQVASAYEFRLTEPRAGETFKTRSMSSIIFAQPVGDMVILDASDEWLTVLLPGWGRAWVQLANAVLSTKAEDTTTSSSAAGLRTGRDLTLSDVEDEQGHVIRALFHVVGSSLEKLRLENCRISDATLRVILRESPNLKELAILDARDSMLRVVTESYEQGHCRAAVIEFSLSSRAPGDYVGASQFFNQLGQKKLQLAKLVRVLHFTFVPDGISALQETIRGMLEHNRYLDELYINWRLEPEHRNDPAENEHEITAEDITRAAVYPGDGLQPLHAPGSRFAELNTFDGQMIPNAGVIEKIVAFLSVARGVEEEAQYPVMAQLDANVLTAIFAFATETHARCVHVQ